jgi:hypothetical protein
VSAFGDWFACYRWKFRSESNDAHRTGSAPYELHLPKDAKDRGIAMLIRSTPSGEMALFMKRLHLGRLWLPSLVILPFLNGCAEKKAPPMMREVVPISVAEVVSKDVPVQVSAIGTVEALSTVSVKSQVNGEIKEVHFKEGQEVKKGDLLFTIDGRPFETDLRRAEANLARDTAQFSQAEANLARDLAQAKNAQVERHRYQTTSTRSSWSCNPHIRGTLPPCRCSISIPPVAVWSL